MAQSGGGIKKETLYIGIGVTLVVGVLVGIVVSSFQSGSGTGSSGQNQGPAQLQGGMTPQQANQIMMLEQQVAASPQNGDAWTQLGHLYFDINRPEQAIRAYNKSLELRPNDPNVLTDLGVMYRRAGRYLEAIASFDKAIALNGSHQQSRFNKGIVMLYDLGDIDGAAAVWEDLLKINPNAQTGNGIPLRQIIDDAKKQKTGAQ